MTILDAGAPERTITFHKQGLALARQIGDRQSKAPTPLANLGDSYAALDDAG